MTWNCWELYVCHSSPFFISAVDVSFEACSSDRLMSQNMICARLCLGTRPGQGTEIHMRCCKPMSSDAAELLACNLGLRGQPPDC